MAHDDDPIVLRPRAHRPPGDFFIDPWRPVERAVITHAHADHAQAGAPALSGQRSGRRRAAHATRRHIITTLAYGESVRASATLEIRCTRRGRALACRRCASRITAVWVASGDYKVAADRTCLAFEPVRCDTFITDSTFGLPVYRWADDATVLQINRGGGQCRSATEHRLLQLWQSAAHPGGLDASVGPIIVQWRSGAVESGHRAAGVTLPLTHQVSGATGAALRDAIIGRAMVICPPSPPPRARGRCFPWGEVALPSG